MITSFLFLNFLVVYLSLNITIFSVFINYFKNNTKQEIVFNNFTLFLIKVLFFLFLIYILYNILLINILSIYTIFNFTLFKIINFTLFKSIIIENDYNFIINTTLNSLLINSLKIPSNNPINSNNPANSNNINPYFITGFTDGDGSFYFSIKKDKRNNWFGVQLFFELSAGNNPANLKMFQEIQNYFGGVGRIYVNHYNVLTFCVSSLKDCIIIRDHFINYPLLTYKSVHFSIWCLVLDIIINKLHLKREGLLKIVALKEHSPNGISEKLKNEFPDYLPVSSFNYLPDFNFLNIHWINGFMNADGTFSLVILKDTKSLLGERVKPSISMCQHNNSIIVLNKIKEFLEMGQVYFRSGVKASDFKISSLKDINKLISLLNETRFLGAKALDYIDFCNIINMINNKQHLTAEGLNIIKQIISGMNSKRTNFEL